MVPVPYWKNAQPRKATTRNPSAPTARARAPIVGHLSDDREDGLAEHNDDEQAKPLGSVFDVDAADAPVGPKAGSNHHHANLDDDRGSPQNDGDVERQDGRDEPEDRCAAVVDPDPPRSFGRIFAVLVAVLVQPQDQQDNTNRSIGQRKGPRPFAKGTGRGGGHDARRSHGSEHRDTQRPGRGSRATSCFNAPGTDDLSIIAPWYWLPRLRHPRFGIVAFVRQEYLMRGASYAQGNIGGKQRSWIRNRYSQK